MKSHLLIGLFSILLTLSFHPIWAEQEIKFADVPIEFKIEIIHDFNQILSLSGNFIDSESNVIYPSAKVSLIDPSNRIILEETLSEAIFFSHIPNDIGEYIIRIQISPARLPRIHLL